MVAYEADRQLREAATLAIIESANRDAPSAVTAVFSDNDDYEGSALNFGWFEDAEGNPVEFDDADVEMNVDQEMSELSGYFTEYEDVKASFQRASDSDSHWVLALKTEAPPTTLAYAEYQMSAFRDAQRQQDTQQFEIARGAVAAIARETFFGPSAQLILTDEGDGSGKPYFIPAKLIDADGDELWVGTYGDATFEKLAEWTPLLDRDMSKVTRDGDSWVVTL